MVLRGIAIAFAVSQPQKHSELRTRQVVFNQIHITIQFLQNGTNWRFFRILLMPTGFVEVLVGLIVRIVLSADSGEDVEVLKEIAHDCG